MMKRIAIFASYSVDNKIHDYVIYYLKELRKVCDNIIFVSDNEVEENEKKKLVGLVCYFICHKHGEYDFGSYKRGYLWAKENKLLDDADELILCNDSCYGPAYPFEDMFLEMKERSCDLWGITESHEYKVHLQSFFLVFKKNVFTSEIFYDYIVNVRKKGDALGVIFSYELNDVIFFEKASFRHSSYIDFNKLSSILHHENDRPVLFPVSLLKLGMPLIKRKTFTDAYYTLLWEPIPDLLDEVKDINKELYGIIVSDISGDIIRSKEKLLMLENIVRDKFQMHEDIMRAKRGLEKKNKKHLKLMRIFVWLSAVLFICLMISVVSSFM